VGGGRRPGEIQYASAAGRVQPSYGLLCVSFRADPRTASRRRPSWPAFLQHIRTHGFSYTLAPGDYRQERRRRVLARPQGGSASTSPLPSVVVMRAAGVPARIVTATSGTDLPAVDCYYSCARARRMLGRVLASGTGWVAPIRRGAVAPTGSAAATGSPTARLRRRHARRDQSAAVLRKNCAACWKRSQPLEPMDPELSRGSSSTCSADRPRRAALGRPPPFCSSGRERAALAVRSGPGSTVHRVDPWYSSSERMKRAFAAARVATAPPTTRPAHWAARVRAGSALPASRSRRLDALESRRYGRRRGAPSTRA